MCPIENTVFDSDSIPTINLTYFLFPKHFALLFCLSHVSHTIMVSIYIVESCEKNII